jgi:cell division protein FtsB
MRVSGVKVVYAMVLLSGVMYAFVALRGPNGISGMMEKQRLVGQYEKDNEQLQREIAAKQERIRLLQSDPRAQEVEIRQRLKLAAPGEKVYIIDEHGK